MARTQLECTERVPDHPLASSHLAAHNDVDTGTGCSLCKRERAGVCGEVVSVGFECYSVHPYGAPCRARLDLVLITIMLHGSPRVKDTW